MFKIFLGHTHTHILPLYIKRNNDEEKVYRIFIDGPLHIDSTMFWHNKPTNIGNLKYK